MSDTFNPGEGWRPLEYIGNEELPRGTVAYLKPGGRWSYWVREAPVPPLPTEPYTVIRVTWSKGEHSTDDIRTLANGYWRGLAAFSTADDLASAITGFEVLSEPRAVTAKAVLDRVVSGGITTADDVELRAVTREFGVGS